MLNDGIYFGMPEDDYHKIDRLSKTGIKRLRVSPADYWKTSPLNPRQEDLTPDQERRRNLARVLGRAYHTARLEPHKFESRFVRKPSQTDYTDQEGFLHTVTMIDEQLVALGQPKTNKADGGALGKALRLRGAGYKGPIWHIIEDEFKASAGERGIVPADAYDQILIDMQRIRKMPDIDKILSGGEAEITLLCTCPDTGIPMKSRIDYLKVEEWAEFKTFDNPNGKNLIQAINDAIRFNGYFIDAVCYHQAIEILRSGALDIIGEATNEQVDLITNIIERGAPLACQFVYQQKNDVPNILAREFELFQFSEAQRAQHAGASPDAVNRVENGQRTKTAIHQKGRMEIAAAKRDYLAYSEIYGEGEEWLPVYPLGKTTDADFPPFWLEQEIR